MTSRLAAGGEAGGRLPFLSAHRCPEVERLPHRGHNGHHIHRADDKHKDMGEKRGVNNEEDDVCDAERKADTPPRAPEADYLDVCDSSRRPASGPSEEKESEDEEGSISDWSEEDLSLHFSPSVILLSDEESGSDSGEGFECVDVAIENPASGQESKDSHTVPKRQIQLKRRDPWDSEEDINLVSKEKPEAREMEAAIGGGGNKGAVSANELLCSPPRHRPELLLRQHSMPATFHECLATNPEDNSTDVYTGTAAEDSLGFHGGVGDRNPRQRLQKSFSLDETKTKIASCIIKSVLSKKMQGEHINSKNHLQGIGPINPTETSCVNNSQSFSTSTSYSNAKKDWQGTRRVTSTKTNCINNIKNSTVPSSNDAKHYVQESGQINSTDTSFNSNIKDSTNTKNYPPGTAQFSVKDAKPQASQYWQAVKPMGRQNSMPLPISQGNKPPEIRDKREREGEREGGGGTGELKFPACSSGKTNISSAPGMFKAMAPVHLVRDMRSLVKKSYNMSFSNNNSSTSTLHSPATTDNTICQTKSTPSASYIAFGQKDSPPPSHQQVPKVKGCKETMATRRGSQSSAQRGYVAKVTAALQQSQERGEGGGFCQSRRGSQPIGNEVGLSDQTLDSPTETSGISHLSDSNLSESERNLQPEQLPAAATQLITAAQNYLSPAIVSYKPPSPSTTSGQPQGTNLPPRFQGKTSMLGTSSSSTPGCVLASSGSSQPLLHSYFYPPGALAGYPALHAHMGNVGYIQGPVSYIQASQPHLQPVAHLQLGQSHPLGQSHLLGQNHLLGQSHPLGQAQAIPTFHLLRNIQSEEGGDGGYNSSTKGCGNNGAHQTVSMESQQQQQFVCGNIQGALPTPARDKFHQDRTGAGYSKMASTSVSPGNLYSGHTPRHVLVDPESGQCFYVDAPPQPQRKMLYDPETGCYVQVLLSSQSSANPAHTTILPVGCSAVPYHQALSMPTMYASHCLPVTLHTQTHNLRHTAP